ncbi:deoxyribonuclease NucA/NucB-domain-containing protein [Sphaerosporella brunnea]|uniref:Deoxyribonuclease NucA/NucB-domain-containing protein n=1 Tax=Sphaerosporella brunnea TaxID=1250544 RepID=A0A5J5F8P2_9PEZI|nr:deoxyribonuclease NucA/NucB-domain-containing protein [Sphaerosporella brunnea]
MYFNPGQLLVILASASLALSINFEWDCTNSLATCNNACYAVNCKGKPGMLNYDSNAGNRGPRRTASGCNRTPCTNTNYRGSGNSCDEYPFASTTQGGTGAILRCVDSTENSSEGGQLGAFYRGLNNGQQFGVVVRNYGGAAFCANAGNCQNDGWEFKLQSGSFVNARDENNGFVPADSSKPGGSPFRKFMGEDGVERLWITKDPSGTIVGDHVWNGEGKKVMIVSEVFD